MYEAQISDAAPITDTGLANLNAFTNTQIITYNGIAIYTVDLSRLSKDSFTINEEKKKVVIQIPHSVCDRINIPSEEIEYGDTERGWLAFGDIKISPEQSSAIETEAKMRMQEKLEELKVRETADRFAKMTVWELYQPIISSVSPEYKMDIVFCE